MDEDIRIGPIHRLPLNDHLERVGVEISDVTIGDGSLNQVFAWSFLPAGTRLQPENLRGDVAVAGIVEQETCHLGVCLDGTQVNLLSIMLA